MKTKVKILQHKLSGGRISLFLDYYPPIPHPKKPGMLTRREFLGLYIYANPDTEEEKKHNAAVLEIAEGVRRAREVAYNKAAIIWKAIDCVDDENLKKELSEYLEGIVKRAKISIGA
jgi:hypothetical protein